MKYLKSYKEMIKHFSQTNDEPPKANPHLVQRLQDYDNQKKEEEKEKEELRRQLEIADKQLPRLR